jgi:hypothetical protein
MSTTRRRDYGRCTIDVGAELQRAYGVYSLPFGRGKQFGANVNQGRRCHHRRLETAVDTTLPLRLRDHSLCRRLHGRRKSALASSR